MGVYTVRPNATVSVGSGGSVVGAANAHTATSDGNEAGSHDSTYVLLTYAANDSVKGVVLDLPAFTIPAGARIVGVRVRERAKVVGASFGGAYAKAQPWVLNAAGTAYAGGAGVAGSWPNTTYALYEGAYETLTPYGTEWLAADLTALRILLTNVYVVFPNSVHITEVWVDAQYIEKPTTTVTLPAESAVEATVFPTVGFTFAQADSVAMDSARVKIFNSAQYGAGGFNPETSTPVADSGWFAASNPGTWTSTVACPTGSYRGYAKTRVSFNGGYFESDWDYNAWTVSVTPPPTPTLAAAAVPANSRTTLTVTSGGGSPTTDGYDFEYSDDGSTWYSTRAGTLVGSGTQVDTDYEAPPNVVRSYRARAYRVASGAKITSAWSTTATATLSAVRWRLVDPYTGTGLWVTLDGDVFSHSSEEQSQALYPIGRKNPVVLSGTIQGETYPLTFPFGSEAEFLAFEVLRSTQHILLLKSARNWQKYIKLVGARDARENRLTADAAPWWYTVTVRAVEQDRP